MKFWYKLTVLVRKLSNENGHMMNREQKQAVYLKRRYGIGGLKMDT